METNGKGAEMQMTKEERAEAVESYKAILQEKLDFLIFMLDREIIREKKGIPVSRSQVVKTEEVARKYDLAVRCGPQELRGEFLHSDDVRKALAIKEGE